jgi:hypothetical protein
VIAIIAMDSGPIKEPSCVSLTHRAPAPVTGESADDRLTSRAAHAGPQARDRLQPPRPRIAQPVAARQQRSLLPQRNPRVEGQTHHHAAEARRCNPDHD